ncbi:MAG: thiamine phosphate synthase [Polyangia bacterium]
MRTITPRLLGEAAEPKPPRLAARLMLITDGVSEPAGAPGAPPLLQRIEAALAAAPPGAVVLQLRNKDKALGGRDLLRLAERLRERTASHGALLLVNDRLDVARIVGADGVHLPSSGLPVGAARRVAGEALLISAATHSLSEARMAALGGADLVTFGPIWPTPSKPLLPKQSLKQGGVTPRGPEALGETVHAVPVPVFALGGIDGPARAAACAAVGARVACLRAGLSDADCGAAVRGLLAALSSTPRSM